MMNKKTEVLIIGAGLSGFMAAAKAAEQGKKVTIVAKGLGGLSLSSGCIDLWGYNLDQPEKICQDPIAEIYKLISINPEHPYGKVADVLTESLSYFKEICQKNGNAYLDNDENNWLLPTALGTVRPTYLAPKSMAVTGLKKMQKIIVVGFKHLKDFYPDVLIKNLKKNGGLSPKCELDSIMVSLDGEELSPNTLAHHLEQSRLINILISQVKPLISPGSVLFFPPVLGDQRDSDVAMILQRELACPVFEVTNIPPSLPGQRLQQTLLHHLKIIGVEVILASTVNSSTISENRCLKVKASGLGKELEITAETFVLATGSFLGGGLASKPEVVQEVVFNLPVKTTGGKWSGRDFLSLEGQAFSRFGIEVNQKLQPIDNLGKVLLENVMITGANLAGANSPIEKCGNGIAVTSGYKAGLLAGEV